MLNVIDDIKDYLEENTTELDHKLEFGKNLFIGHMPSKTKMCLTLSQSNPVTTYNYNRKIGEEVYPIRFRIRGNAKENETRAFAKIIHDVLEDIQDIEFEGYRLIRGAFETKPNQIEPRDEENNFIYIAIYEALVERI